MKHLKCIMLLAGSMALAGCGKVTSPQTGAADSTLTETGNRETVIRLRPAANLGKLAVRRYEGIMVGGAYGTLSVYAYRHSGDGVFVLEVMSRNNELTTSSGTLYTLRGENDATIWECRDEGTGRSVCFLCDTKGNRIFSVANDHELSHDHPMRQVSESELP